MRGLGRLGGILGLPVLLGIAGASRSRPAVGDSTATSPVPPATAGPETRPFTDRELADELRRQGIGVAATGQTARLFPEINATPRGVVITLPHTDFAFDSDNLVPQARRVVARIAYVLNHPRAMRRLVVLEGHADSIGTEAYNLALSRRRAEAVARELIGQGVQRGPVMIEAYGKSRSIGPNETPDGTDNRPGARGTGVSRRSFETGCIRSVCPRGHGPAGSP